MVNFAVVTTAIDAIEYSVDKVILDMCMLLIASISTNAPGSVKLGFVSG